MAENLLNLYYFYDVSCPIMAVKELSVGQAIRLKNLKKLSLKNTIGCRRMPFTVWCQQSHVIVALQSQLFLQSI